MSMPISLPIDSIAKWSTLAIALVFFVSMALVSMVFFKIEDGGAKFGKRLISILAGIGMAIAIGSMARSAARDWYSYLPSAILYSYALWLFWSAYFANRNHPLNFAFTNAVPNHLVRIGSYRRIRHPFYAAYIGAWLASFFAAPHLLTALVLTTMTCIYFMAARQVEKSFLASEMHTSYKEYQRTSGMFIPPVWRT